MSAQAMNVTLLLHVPLSLLCAGALMLRDGKVPQQTLLRMLRGVNGAEFDGIVWGAEHLTYAQVRLSTTVCTCQA